MTNHRTYPDHEEQCAYLIGHYRGTQRLERIPHAGAEPLAYSAERRWPNAYSAGYWDAATITEGERRLRMSATPC